jgi:hypothetical protein
MQQLNGKRLLVLTAGQSIFELDATSFGDSSVSSIQIAPGAGEVRSYVDRQAWQEWEAGFGFTS